MYGRSLQEWHGPTFSFLFFSERPDELMLMMLHRHVASKLLDTRIFADRGRFGRY